MLANERKFDFFTQVNFMESESSISNKNDKTLKNLIIKKKN